MLDKPKHEKLVPRKRDVFQKEWASKNDKIEPPVEMERLSPAVSFWVTRKSYEPREGYAQSE